MGDEIRIIFSFIENILKFYQTFWFGISRKFREIFENLAKLIVNISSLEKFLKYCFAATLVRTAGFSLCFIQCVLHHIIPSLTTVFWPLGSTLFLLLNCLQKNIHKSANPFLNWGINYSIVSYLHIFIRCFYSSYWATLPSPHIQLFFLPATHPSSFNYSTPS